MLKVTGIAAYAAGSTLYSSQAGEITCSKVFCLKRQHHENVEDFLQPLAFIEPMSHLSTGSELRHGGKKLNHAVIAIDTHDSLFAGDKDNGETCLDGVTVNGDAIKIQA